MDRNIVLYQDSCMGMDDSVRRRAIQEIRRILETAGYDIEEEGDPFDLSALSGSECILALCTNDPGRASKFDRKPYILEEKGEKIPCKKLIFTQNPAIVAEEGFLWGIEELGKHAGEATVARVRGERYPIRWRHDQTDMRNTIRAPGSPPAGQITILPICAGADEAVRISGERGPAHLRLIPHWAYQYSCTGDASYKGKKISFDAEGTGAISAINGLPQDIDPTNAVEREIPGDADLIRPAINMKDAEEKILSSLIETLSKRVRIKTESGDAIFSEEKTFKPSRNQIQQKIWLVYVPVWQIRGKHIVEVNAVTGEILAEPMDEGVELL